MSFGSIFETAPNTGLTVNGNVTPGAGSFDNAFLRAVSVQAGYKVGNGQKILLSLVALVLLNVLLVIIFGDRGLVEVNRLREERDRLLRDNRDLKVKNLSLHREIERLKTDSEYIEHVARQELGMIGRDEVIIRFNAPGKKETGRKGKSEQP